MNDDDDDDDATISVAIVISCPRERRERGKGMMMICHHRGKRHVPLGHVLLPFGTNRQRTS